MDFYKRVAYVVKEIPKGRVATYGQIAMLCGKPQNSRQVGYALNRKIEDHDVPAHRVVNHKGCLSGAFAFDTWDLQRRLLDREGVEVSEDNRVDLKVYGWKNSLEDAIRFRKIFGDET